MQKLSNQEKLRPWMGVALFIFIMAVFLTLGQYMQVKWGMTGLVFTELMFLAIAVIFSLIRGVSLKEVFPVKKITLRDLFGCAALHAGGFLLSYISIALVGIIYPKSLKIADSLNDFMFGNLTFIPALLIIGLLPAICEEAIHRGAILSCFRSIKKDWIIVLIMAIFFGVNHIYIIKFFSTAILGGVLAYVLVKKNNILLTMLMHFTNNALSVIVTYRQGAESSDAASIADMNLVPVLGVYMIIGCVVPFLFVVGSLLLKPEEHKKKRFAIAAIVSVIMVISGAMILIKGGLSAQHLNSTVSYEVTAEEKEIVAAEFDVEEDMTAYVVVSCGNSSGDYRVRIDGDRGSNIINAPLPEPVGNMRTFWYQCGFQSDHYTVYIVADDNAVGETPKFSIVIQ